MRAYLLTTATIFSLFAVTHAIILYFHWGGSIHDVLPPAIILVGGAALAIWGFRLSGRVGGPPS